MNKTKIKKSITEEFTGDPIDDGKVLLPAFHSLRQFVSSNQLDEAIAAAESIIFDIENSNYYQNTTDKKYYAFRNPFEAILFEFIHQPEWEVLLAPVTYYSIYNNYGAMLVEKKQYDDAERVLLKVCEINPMSTDAAYELTILMNFKKDLDSYFSLTKECLNISCTRESLARGLRNIGKYYMNIGKYDLASAAFTASSQYEPETIVLKSFIDVLAERSRGIYKNYQLPDAIKMLEAESIPTKPSGTVVNLAMYLLKEAQKDGKPNIANYYRQVLLGMTPLGISTGQKLEALN